MASQSGILASGPGASTPAFIAQLSGHADTIWVSLSTPAATEPIVNITFKGLACVVILLLIPLTVSYVAKLGMVRPLLVSSGRCLVQLLLLGTILKLLIQYQNMYCVLLYIAFMMMVASFEAGSRPSMSYVGMHWDVGLCLIVPAGAALLYMVLVVIHPSPWFNAQYTVPLVGMMLGNSLNGVTVGVKTMLESLSAERASVEWALMMGATRWEAVAPVFTRVLHTAMTPIINMLSVAGLISIPGMMTGQILAGGDAVVAAKYQIMILFGVAAVAATACTMCIALATVRLTDSHHRLRLDQLIEYNDHSGKWIWSKFEGAASWCWNKVKQVLRVPSSSAHGSGGYDRLPSTTAGTAGTSSV